MLRCAGRSDFNQEVQNQAEVKPAFAEFFDCLWKVVFHLSLSWAKTVKDKVSDHMRMAITVFSIIVLCCLLAYQSLIAWDVRNVRDSQRAYGNFVFDAATLGCVRHASIIRTAEARGWQFEDDRQPPFMSWSPDKWTKAVRVFIEPQLNFAKEPGVMFFFDDEDCLIGHE